MKITKTVLCAILAILSAVGFINLMDSFTDMLEKHAEEARMIEQNNDSLSDIIQENTTLRIRVDALEARERQSISPMKCL